MRDLTIERYFIAIASGTVSICASLLMAIVIPRANAGLSTPYRRIIFGLSISDVIQSSATVLGPFLLPRETKSYGPSWAIGNIHTCEFQGFAFTFGAVATCMYSLFLCVYYYCKLRRNMSDGAFMKKIEKKVHLFIVLFNSIMCSVALATKTFNPLSGSGSCPLTPPPGCDPGVQGSCQRGQYSKIFLLIYFPIAVPFICVFGSILLMLSIVVHVIRRDRLFGHGPRNKDNRVEEESDADRVARLLRREVALQVVLYVLSFLLTYGWIVMITFLYPGNNSTPLFVSVTVAALFPLMGFFNILIYTRPQVVAYRRWHNEISWPAAFWHVLKAGGGNPDATTSVSYSRSLIYCKGLLLCLFSKKQEHQSRSVPSGILRLRALYGDRDPSHFDGTLGQNEIKESCSMEHRLSMIPTPNPAQYETEDGSSEVDHSGNSLIASERVTLTNTVIPDEQSQRNVQNKVMLESNNKEAISKAFAKASQRVMAMNVVRDKGGNKNEDVVLSKDLLDERSNSRWSNGASPGSLSGSVFDMEPDENV
mmetsp:Transcript_2998/g.5608  ORF Transcript_2998/g.5608 Transcript_2998/m.5608 type:complete len:536 (-) Transcript_2998:45-1652(-)